jgi:3-hydroxypropanoate dehydrogenase
MGGFDRAGLDAEFFPDSNWRPILVVNICHPGESPRFDRASGGSARTLLREQLN